jgi:hypothetical protein
MAQAVRSGIDDFGGRVGFLLAEPESYRCEDRSSPVFESMMVGQRAIQSLEAILTHEKVPLRRTVIPYPRDYYFADPNGRWSLPPWLARPEVETVLTAQKRAFLAFCHEGRNPRMLVHYDYAGLDEMPAEARQPSDFMRELYAEAGKEARVLDVSLKGGNLLRCKGCVLIAEHEFEILLQQLRLTGYFLRHREPMRKAAAGINDSVDLVPVCRRMHYLGIGSNREQRVDPEEVISAYVEAGSKALSEGEELPQGRFARIIRATQPGFDPALIETRERREAKDYLVQRRMLKEILGRAFGVEWSQVVLLPSLAYHLDLVLCPGPGNLLFVADPSASLELLQKIERASLSAEDAELLDTMMKQQRDLATGLGGLTEELKSVLTLAEFRVVPTPGSFPIVSKTRRSLIHFLNAITGKSFADRKEYFITTSFAYGEKLGDVISKAFVEFLHRYLPEGCRIYQIQGGEKLFDPEGILAGPHCMTAPFPVASS